MHQVEGAGLSVEQVRAIREEMFRAFGPLSGGVAVASYAAQSGTAPQPQVGLQGSPVIAVLLGLLDLVQDSGGGDRVTPAQRLVTEAVMGLLTWSHGFPPLVTPAAERPLWRLLEQRTRSGDLLPMLGYCVAKMRATLRLIAEAGIPSV
jgi:hypothetical protein